MSDMADVLARRNFELDYDGYWEDCPEDAKRGWIEDAQRTLDFLAAAGFGLAREAGAVALEQAASLVASEEQHQWRRDSQRLPGAQIVAQRMQVLVRILRGRAAAVRGEG